MTTDQGGRLTRELIAADPDGALTQIETLAQRANSAEELVAELRNQLQERETGIAAAEERAALASGENESLRRQLDDGAAQHTSLLTGQEEALAAYRAMVLQREPALPPELIRGGSLQALNEAIQSAREIVTHVQANVEHSQAASRIPAGAPLRRLQPDPSGMSAQEKLAYGVRVARGEELGA